MEILLKYCAWPGVVLILGIIVIFVFKSPISSLIARLKTFKISGVSAYSETSAQQTPQNSSGSIPDRAALDNLMRAIPDSKLLQETEENIKNELRNKNITSPEDIMQVLYRYLAWAQLKLRFETAYSMIYGSQLVILNRLNMSTNGIEVMGIRAIYDSVASRYSETYLKYPFENYMGFLIRGQFVKQENDRFHITSLGREFLTYLVNNGMDQNLLL